MKHDRITNESQELAALYALGALSQYEAKAFDAHLREGCAVCTTELTQFNSVVGVLGTEATPVTAPAYLRDLLTMRINREASAAPPASASVIQFPEQAGVARKPALERTTLGRTLLPWAIAAALLVAFGYTFVKWQADRRSFEAALDQNKGAASEALNENADLRAQIGQLNDTSTELAEINSVLRSARWRIIPLSGQNPARDSSARVYWDVQGNRWVVTADLPPPPEGKIYQLWFVMSDAKISAGFIKPDNRGHGFTVVDLPRNVNQLAAVAITLEPEGGSQQPTMPIYALGKAS
ncbi:MAG: anti-sigma factor [Blastocatellia bacterium]